MMYKIMAYQHPSNLGMEVTCQSYCLPIQKSFYASNSIQESYAEHVFGGVACKWASARISDCTFKNLRGKRTARFYCEIEANVSVNDAREDIGFFYTSAQLEASCQNMTQTSFSFFSNTQTSFFIVQVLQIPVGEIPDIICICRTHPKANPV